MMTEKINPLSYTWTKLPEIVKDINISHFFHHPNVKKFLKIDTTLVMKNHTV